MVPTLAETGIDENVKEAYSATLETEPSLASTALVPDAGATSMLPVPETNHDTLRNDVIKQSSHGKPTETVSGVEKSLDKVERSDTVGDIAVYDDALESAESVSHAIATTALPQAQNPPTDMEILHEENQEFRSGWEEPATPNKATNFSASSPQSRIAAPPSTREPAAEASPPPSRTNNAAPPVAQASTAMTTRPKPKPHSKLPTKRARYAGKPKNPSSNKKNDKDFRPDDSSDDDKPAAKKRKTARKAGTTSKARRVKNTKKNVKVPKTRTSGNAKKASASSNRKGVDNTSFDGVQESELGGEEMQNVAVHEDTTRDVNMAAAYQHQDQQNDMIEENGVSGRGTLASSPHLSQKEAKVEKHGFVPITPHTVVKHAITGNPKATAVSIDARTPPKRF